MHENVFYDKITVDPYGILLNRVINLSAQVTAVTLSGIVKDPKGTGVASTTVAVGYPDAGVQQNFIIKANGRREGATSILWHMFRIHNLGKRNYDYFLIPLPCKTTLMQTFN